MDGTSQVYHTDAYKASLDPKWNNHYDLYLSRGDGITISVWNQRKLMKKNNGFLGCVRIMSSTIQRLKDTGCKISLISTQRAQLNFPFFFLLHRPTTRAVQAVTGRSGHHQRTDNCFADVTRWAERRQSVGHCRTRRRCARTVRRRSRHQQCKWASGH